MVSVWLTKTMFSVSVRLWHCESTSTVSMICGKNNILVSHYLLTCLVYWLDLVIFPVKWYSQLNYVIRKWTQCQVLPWITPQSPSNRPDTKWNQNFFFFFKLYLQLKCCFDQPWLFPWKRWNSYKTWSHFYFQGSILFFAEIVWSK